VLGGDELEPKGLLKAEAEEAAEVLANTLVLATVDAPAEELGEENVNPVLELELNGFANVAPVPNGELPNPAPDVEVVAPKETVPGPDETPAPKDTVPGPDEEAPAPEDTIPGPDEEAPAPNDMAPSPDEVAPDPKDTAPGPDEAAPTTKGTVPDPDEEAPAPKEKTPGPDE